MAEKPIIFSTPMVQAILRGEKTMTRRIMNGYKNHDYDFNRAWVDPSGFCSGIPVLKSPYKHKSDQWEEDPKDDPVERLWPRFQVGDLLWVKERWSVEYVERHFVSPDFISIRYEADGANTVYYAQGHERRYDKYESDDVAKLRKKRPSIFMPRWASRITLEVTAVNVERLQDISEADAMTEGVRTFNAPLYADEELPTYRNAFARLWGEINGKGSWDLNPWVEAYAFRVVKK